MQTHVAVTSKEVLSCGEAELILKTIQLDTICEPAMGDVQWAATQHYIKCNNCRKKGLAAILGKYLTCEEALLRWAAYKELPYGAQTLNQRLAMEHVVGYYKLDDSRDSRVDKAENDLGSESIWWGAWRLYLLHHCTEATCSRFRSYVLEDTNFLLMGSSRGEGKRISYLLNRFKEEKWDMAGLFLIQKLYLLRECPNSKHLERHIDFLQELALSR